MFKEIHRKVPTICTLEGSKLQISNSTFKGDTTNDADTAGIVVWKGDAEIKNC